MQTPITPPPQTRIFFFGEEVEVEVEDDSILIWSSARVDWPVMIVVLTRDVVHSVNTIFMCI